MILDRLNDLACEAAKHASPPWKVRADDYELEVISANGDLGYTYEPVCTPSWDDDDSVAEYIAACDPLTIQRLVRVARIAVATRSAWAREDVSQPEVVALVQEFDAALDALGLKAGDAP